MMVVLSTLKGDTELARTNAGGVRTPSKLHSLYLRDLGNGKNRTCRIDRQKHMLS